MLASRRPGKRRRPRGSRPASLGTTARIRRQGHLFVRSEPVDIAATLEQEEAEEEESCGFWTIAERELAQRGWGRASQHGPGMHRFWQFIDFNANDEELPAAYKESGCKLCGLIYPGLRTFGREDRPEPFAPVEAYGSTVVSLLESAADEVRREVLSLPPDAFSGPEGQPGWGMLTLRDLGRPTDKSVTIGERLPRTLSLLSDIDATGWLAPESVKVLRQSPKTGLRPHIDGLNMVLCCHLGLVIPQVQSFAEAGDNCAQPWIECGGTRRHWTEGKGLVFDQAFVHSTYNPAGEDRYVLALDLWHHDLSAEERGALTEFFRIVDDWNSRFEAYYGMHLPHGWFKM